MDKVGELFGQLKTDKCFTIWIHYMPGDLFKHESWGVYYSYNGDPATSAVQRDTLEEALEAMLEFVEWLHA